MTALSFLGGTVYGFKEGARNFALLEHVAQGALSRYQLASIEAENVENVIHLFELKIDSGIHAYAEFKKDGNELLSAYLLPENSSEIDRYLAVMAEYRRDHEIVFSPAWAEPNENDSEETKEFKRQGHKESQEILRVIRKTLQEHGVPQSALTR